MVPEFPSNSSLSKEKAVETRELPPVPEAPVVKVKKRNRLLGFIFSRDFRDIKEGLVEDFIKPKVQDAVNTVFENILDTGREAIQMMIFEDGRRPRGRQNTPYDAASWRNGSISSHQSSVSRSNREPVYTDLNDIVLDSRADCEKMLAWLDEIIDRYKWVQVADVYEYLHLSAPYTANNYGWSDLRSAEVLRCQEGYYINFPKALPNKR